MSVYVTMGSTVAEFILMINLLNAIKMCEVPKFLREFFERGRHLRCPKRNGKMLNGHAAVIKKVVHEHRVVRASYLGQAERSRAKNLFGSCYKEIRSSCEPLKSTCTFHVVPPRCSALLNISVVVDPCLLVLEFPLEQAATFVQWSYTVAIFLPGRLRLNPVTAVGSVQ